MQCSCGKWVTPAFQIHKNRVDEVSRQLAPSWHSLTANSVELQCLSLRYLHQDKFSYSRIKQSNFLLLALKSPTGEQSVKLNLSAVLNRFDTWTMRNFRCHTSHPVTFPIKVFNAYDIRLCWLYHFSLKIGVPYEKAVFMQVLPTSYSLNNHNNNYG